MAESDSLPLTHPADAPGTRSFDPNRTAASSRPDADSDGGTGIPGYVILAELGQGGMGIVYRARQSALNREVALKTILRADASEAMLKRFWSEAEVMAAVAHPNVAQVFAFGDHAARPYMAMELVTGGSLADRIAAGPLAPSVAAELLEKVARGVNAAHELGIIHRDLKPANVLLTRDGEPKVADFGLAKWRTTDLTRTQTLMGTPAYMAPEQAAGRARFVGPQADVWALGVILYECLAGAKPFDGTTVEVLLTQIQISEPDAPRKRVRGLSRNLETIILKCLSKEPERRYPTAGELADDLRRYLDGRPIAARPVGRAERLVRWARRKPTAAAAYALSAVAVALALVGLVVGGLWREADQAKVTAEAATRRADDARGRVEDLLDVEKALRGDLQTANTGLQTALEREQAAKQREERANERLARFNYGQTIKAAYQAWRDNKIAEARTLLAQTRPNLRGWEYDYVHRLCHPGLVTLSHVDLEAQGLRYSPLTHAAWSPDGSKVLTGEQGFVRMWNADSGTMAHEFRVSSAAPTGVAFSPDGSKFFVADKGGTFVRDTASGKSLVQLKGPAAGFASVVWSANGSRLLTFGDRFSADASTYALVWDTATGARVAELKGPSKRIVSGAFSPDGAKVLLADQERVRIWDATTGKPLVEFGGEMLSVASAAWSPDGTRVIASHTDQTVRLWDATGAERFTFRGHTGRVVNALFSPDGTKILSASDDGTARVWDAATGQAVVELRGHTGALVGASYSRDGTRIVTASKDGTARVWTVGGMLVNELKGHEKELLLASFSPDGAKVLTASADKTARVWDATRNVAQTEYAGRGALVSAAWSDDGAKLAVATTHGPVRILDAGTGRKLTELPVMSATVRWGPDGASAFVLGFNEPPTVWDAVTGKRKARFTNPSTRPTGSAWSADGAKIVTAAGDAPPRVWDARTGNVLVAMDRGNDPFVSSQAHFSPDGTRILGAQGWVACVWDAATGKQLVEFKGHGSAIATTRWSPDGTRILTGGKNGTARVWDAATGKQLLVLSGPILSFVSEVLWSADGERIVTGGAAVAPRVWDSRTGALLAELGAYPSEVTSLRWLDGETRVLTTARDNVLRVWDTASGAELLALPAHEPANSRTVAHVSPDGTRILVRGAGEGVAVVYDSRPVNRAFVRHPIAPPPRPVP